MGDLHRICVSPTACKVYTDEAALLKFLLQQEFVCIGPLHDFFTYTCNCTSVQVLTTILPCIIENILVHCVAATGAHCHDGGWQQLSQNGTHEFKLWGQHDASRSRNKSKDTLHNQVQNNKSLTQPVRTELGTASHDQHCSKDTDVHGASSMVCCIMHAAALVC